MPLLKIIDHNPSTKIYLWTISETFDELFSDNILTEKSKIRIKNMKSQLHQRAFLSVRKLLQIASLIDHDLDYDLAGKPFLNNNKFISISHSHEMSAIIISDRPVGIDIEIKKEKVLKIVDKFMDTNHLLNLSHTDKIKKATIIWGIKETVFKIKNIKGISFKNHISENNFNLTDKNTQAKLTVNNKVENFNVFFEEVNNYVLVWSFIIE